MKYLDTGSRNSAHTLACWLEGILKEDVTEFRIQSGFYSLNGIGLLLPTLERCKQHDLITKILIGSNDASTLKDELIYLVDKLGIPRSGANLGVVSFGGAFFHPKTYHIKREDGSQAAFVGSANLTASGLSLHVEAGIALDTRDGDAAQELSEIAAAVDSWFAEQREGMTLISSLLKVDELVDSGVIALTRPPRPTPPGNGTRASQSHPRAHLQHLFRLPPALLQTSPPAAQVTTPVVTTPTTPVPLTINLPSVPLNGFPNYLLFEPNATKSTEDAFALTGSPLPGNSAGLIIQLNKDSARHFMGKVGTANTSIPVATVSTLRFGIAGIHNTPSALFDLHLRFIGDNILINAGIKRTSIKGYGLTKDETGHGDIRMVIPAATSRLGDSITAAGKSPPQIDDLAFLEWPTLQDPAFRLSFLDTSSSIYQQALNTFNNAITTKQLVGHGACWLASGLSPHW